MGDENKPQNIPMVSGKKIKGYLNKEGLEEMQNNGEKKVLSLKSARLDKEKPARMRQSSFQTTHMRKSPEEFNGF